MVGYERVEQCTLIDHKNPSKSRHADLNVLHSESDRVSSCRLVIYYSHYVPMSNHYMHTFAFDLYQIRAFSLLSICLFDCSIVRVLFALTPFSVFPLLTWLSRMRLCVYVQRALNCFLPFKYTSLFMYTKRIPRAVSQSIIVFFLASFTGSIRYFRTNSSTLMAIWMLNEYISTICSNEFYPV